MNLDMSKTHYLYKDQLPHWIEAYDFYRGGRHVLFPSGRNASGLITTEVSLDASVDGQSGEETPSSRYLLRARQDISYLFAHVRESKRGYMDRISRSVHSPAIMRNCVDAFASAALRTDPSYVGPIDIEPWVLYHDNVDRRGTSFPSLIRQALSYALVYGLEYAITDRTLGDGEVYSLEQQQARGERTYTYLVSPTDVLDWSINADSGAYDWVKIREPYSAPRDPSEESCQPMWQYRIWYPDRWELYRREHGSRNDEMVDAREHPVGEVPVAVCYARQSYESRFDLTADSMLADAVYADREMFNDMSLLREQLVGHCFSQLFLPDDGTNQWSGVDIGVGVAIPYNSEHGQPMMLSPDPGLLLAQLQIMQGKLQMLKESIGLGRGKAEYSKEERSGEALAVESRNENNQVASLAASVEEFDRTIHRHVAAWEGLDVYPVGSYSRDVSLRSVSAQLSDALQLKSLGVPYEVLVEIIKPLLTQTMVEQGTPKDVVAKAVAGLNKPKPQPRFVPLGDGAEDDEEGEDDPQGL